MYLRNLWARMDASLVEPVVRQPADFLKPLGFNISSTGNSRFPTPSPRLTRLPKLLQCACLDFWPKATAPRVQNQGPILTPHLLLTFGHGWTRTIDPRLIRSVL